MGKPPGRFRAGDRGRDSLEDRNTEGKRTATMYFIDVVVMLLQPTLYIFFAALSLAQFQILYSYALHYLCWRPRSSESRAECTFRLCTRTWSGFWDLRAP